MSIKYYGIKIIAIYKYLLSLNIDENHETMPYINSKIIEDFNKYEIEVTQSAYMKDSQKDDNYVDLLFNLIKEYYEFKPYEKQSKLEKLLENNCFIRDCTGAMMIILNSAFFKISNKNINRMMDLIKNNSYLKKIIEDGTMGKQSLDRDYIFQYTSRFLFNAEFINQENIENDLLIKAIKEGIFKDKNTFQQIFKNINIYILLQAFNKNLSLLIDSLEKAFEDDLVKLDLFNIVYIKIIEEKEFRIIINFIMHDNRSEKYISVQERKKVINEFSNNYPVEISDEEIEFVLKQENIDLFLISCVQLYD